MKKKPSTLSAALDTLAEPVPLGRFEAIKGVGAMLAVKGTQIVILAGRVEVLEIAWKILMPNVPFCKDLTQLAVIAQAPKVEKTQG